MLRRALLAPAIVLCLVAAACSSGDDGAERSEPDGADVSDSTTGSDLAEPSNPFVQDLWIYDQLRTLNGAGDIVDHTSSIVEHFEQSTDDAEPIVLIEGMTFTPVPEVAVVINGPDGSRRSDTEAIAGVIENEIGIAFAVLGTVAADGERQIEPDDRVFIDMSFLGDAIEPDDLVAADFMLVQLVPTDDAGEADLSPLELFEHRASAEEILYSADEDGDPIVYANELGRIIVGSMGPEIPPKAKPMLSGFKDGVKKCLSRPGIGCIPSYMAKFGKGATDSLGQIDKQLPIKRQPEVIPPPKPHKPSYIPPARPRDREPLACQNGGCGKSSGDPHLATFDGHRYGMQAQGELVLARHEADDVEIQIRTVGTASRRLSVVSQAVVGVGESRIAVEGGVVTLDDEVVTDEELTTGVTGDGFELTRTYGTSTVVTETGHTITFEQRSSLSLDIVVSPAEGSTGWVGLLGDRDGDATNDLTGRDGTQFSPDLSFEELYEELVMSWRINDDESLFTYADGESTATFTDLSVPEAAFGVEDIAPEERRRATAACELAGIQAPAVLDECILDFAATGEIGFLLSAQLSDAIEGILSGRLDPNGSEKGEPEDGGQGGEEDSSDHEAWYRSGHIVYDEESLTIECPATTSGFGLRYLYGDNPYHSSSGVCRAAVHAGVITAEGGSVRVTREPAQDSFPSVERNGLTSDAWDQRGRSFSVSPG